MERHERDVVAIAAQVKGVYERGESFRIHHGSTNSTRISVFQRKKTIDISHLKYVLAVNVQSRTVLVEPNVPMDRLADTTLKYGLIPPVVMEFPGITVGGGYAGTSGESSSFKYGFFDRTINYVEMVLADGSTIKASNSENEDLFHGAAGACGTLGITTLVELQLIEAKNYVEITYSPVTSMSPAVDKICQNVEKEDQFDYIDGIMFSEKQGVIITGRLTDDRADTPATIPSPSFSGAWDPWFYLHVRDAISKSDKPVTEYVALEEYLFRYDRGSFWVGYSAFQYMLTPFNKYTRWWLDKFMHTRMLYTALHHCGHSKPYVVQDLALPMSRATEFVEFTNEVFGIWPIWLCPLRQSPHPTFHPHCPEIEADEKISELMLNIGLWGFGTKSRDVFIKANRQLESKLRELGGMKWLYAHTYYSENDFWEIYGREWYDQLRHKYHASSLPTVYDKVKIDVDAETRAIKSSWSLWLLSSFPFDGAWAIWKTTSSRQYLLANKQNWQSIEEEDRKDI